MKQFFIFFLLLFSLSAIGQKLKPVQFNYSNGTPIQFAKVLLNDNPQARYYVNEGLAFLPAVDSAYDVTLIYANGKSEKFQISTEKNILQSTHTFTAIKEAGSPKNYWVGARVGYNLSGGDATENFVGAVKAAINVSETSNDAFQFAVVGNVGNFKFDQSKEENEKIQKLAQSTSGLQIGLGWTKQTNLDGTLTNESLAESKKVGRAYFLTYYKYNQFVGVGLDKEDVNFSQFKLAGGLEFEYKKFLKGGALTFAIEPSLTFFDKTLYNKLFGKSKSSLLALDASTTIPISSNVGFHINGTYSHEAGPVYMIGFIVKAE